jgi:hypothetical protein
LYERRSVSRAFLENGGTKRGQNAQVSSKTEDADMSKNNNNNNNSVTIIREKSSCGSIIDSSSPINKK